MKKLFAKENIITIVLSVVASIIFAHFVDPMMNFLGEIGNRLIEIAVNYYYVSCANTTNTTFTEFIVYIIFVWGIANIVTTLRPHAFPYSKKNRDKDNIKPTDKNEKGQLSILDIEKKISILEAEIQELESTKVQTQNKVKIVSRLMLFAIFCFFLWVIVFIYSPVLAKNDFDRKVIQITPYVDSIELAHLNADWVSMETRSDYLILKDKLQNIMEANDIK